MDSRGVEHRKQKDALVGRFAAREPHQHGDHRQRDVAGGQQLVGRHPPATRKHAPGQQHAHGYRPRREDPAPRPQGRSGRRGDRQQQHDDRGTKDPQQRAQPPHGPKVRHRVEILAGRAHSAEKNPHGACHGNHEPHTTYRDLAKPRRELNATSPCSPSRSERNLHNNRPAQPAVSQKAPAPVARPQPGRNPDKIRSTRTRRNRPPRSRAQEGSSRLARGVACWS